LHFPAPQLAKADGPEWDELIASRPNDQHDPTPAALKAEPSMQTQFSEGVAELEAKLEPLGKWQAERTREEVQARPLPSKAKVEPVKVTGGDAEHNAVLAKVKQHDKLLTNALTNDVTALCTKLLQTTDSKSLGQKAVGTADPLKQEVSNVDSYEAEVTKGGALTKAVKTVSAESTRRSASPHASRRSRTPTSRAPTRSRPPRRSTSSTRIIRRRR